MKLLAISPSLDIRFVTVILLVSERISASEHAAFKLTLATVVSLPLDS